MIQSPLHNRSVNLDLKTNVTLNATTLKLQAGVFNGSAVGLTTVKLNDIILNLSRAGGTENRCINDREWLPVFQ